jgi:hypothetical protein
MIINIITQKFAAISIIYNESDIYFGCLLALFHFISHFQGPDKESNIKYLHSKFQISMELEYAVILKSDSATPCYISIFLDLFSLTNKLVYANTALHVFEDLSRSRKHQMKAVN